MTFSLLALILIPVGYFALWPLVARWLGPDGSSPLETALAALGLSVGALGLLLMWIGFLPGRRLTGWAALIVVLLSLGIGLAVNRAWVAPSRWRAYWQAQWRRLIALDLDALLLWTIIGALAVILINDLYYPFIGDDVLARYGLHARQIYDAGRIPNSVWGYPPLAPLAFVATWFAAGEANEHLARLFPFVMAAGSVGAAILIGRRLYGRTAGLLAGAVIALTPMFVNYATLAYTDIPTAFPLALAALFVLRWWESGRGRDAALSGALLGAAILTKQSALTGLASLAALPPLWLAGTRGQPIEGRWRRALSALAWMIVLPVVIAGPWFVRNALIGTWRNAIPVAGLYHILGEQTGWQGIIPPLGWPRDFGHALAPVYGLGWIVGLVMGARQTWGVIRGDIRDAPNELILLAVIVPYWLAWWLRFSFEGRFLLVILPLYAALAAWPGRGSGPRCWPGCCSWPCAGAWVECIARWRSLSSPMLSG